MVHLIIPVIILGFVKRGAGSVARGAFFGFAEVGSK